MRLPRAESLVTAYRDLRSTLAGTLECDGMIAVAHRASFASLNEFVATARSCLTTRWAFANESEGRWYGKPQRIEETESDGPNGRVRRGVLLVHTVGWFGVHDAPAELYAVDHVCGLVIAIWILERNGGAKRAKIIADRVAASFAH